MLAQEDTDWQDDDEETTPLKYPMFFGLSFQTLRPIGTFGETMTQPGYGGQLEYLVNLNQSPLYAGFVSAFHNFGSEAYDFIDPQGFNLTWKTNSVLWSSHLILRFEPKMVFPVQPYLSGQFGFNHFFTATRLIDPEIDDNPLERFVDDKSWSSSYGGSLGVLIPFDKEWRNMLDLRVTYLKGGRSSFYTKKQETFTIVDDSLDAFDLESSTVATLGLQIGVLFFIN